MKESLLTLLTSKRAMIAAVTVVVDVALVFGFELEIEMLKMLLSYVNGLAVTLIGGISVSDHGKAAGQAPGVDHKGRTDGWLQAVPDPVEDAETPRDPPPED